MIGDNNRKYRMQALTKRVVSVLLIVGMIAAILPNLAKDDVAYADDAAGTVTRGVINSLGQLPQYDAANPGQFKNPNAARGTAERPFVILEVVPYEEYAEIGYMISGCEPVKVEEMFGRRDLKKIESIGAASVVQQSGYFFSDEPEGDKAKYDGSCDWRSPASVTGSYELVEDGIGKFKRETFENAEDGSLETRIVKAEGGNLIWHSVNNFEPEYSAEKFSDSLEKELSNIGDRIYTTRTATGEDQALYTYEYYSYQNKELFLSKTLGLEGDAADNYSIVVKTITPEELNAAATYNETTKTWFNTWVSYADLIYVYPQTHMSDFQSVWQKYNRLGHEAVAGASSDKKGFTGAKELSWGTVYSIYEKITADTNYAGLILDKRIYEVDKKTITMQVYDWNLKKVQRYNNGSWQNVTYQY